VQPADTQQPLSLQPVQSTALTPVAAGVMVSAQDMGDTGSTGTRRGRKQGSQTDERKVADLKSMDEVCGRREWVSRSTKMGS